MFKEQDLFNCLVANGCFIKRWEMDREIVNSVKKVLAQNKEVAEKFFSLTSQTMETVDLKAVFVAARANDPVASEALEAAAKRLGIKIAQLVNLLNPQLVVIGGGLEEAGDVFLNNISSTVKEWAFREVTDDLKITYSQLRENAVALGAASLVMQRLFAQVW